MKTGGKLLKKISVDLLTKPNKVHSSKLVKILKNFNDILVEKNSRSKFYQIFFKKRLCKRKSIVSLPPQ
jgi:hypothetical protein